MRRSHSLPGGRVALPGLILLAAACASIRLAPMRADDEPFVPETNERELWLEADRFERRIVASGALNEDAPLEAYLNSVVARLAAGRVDSSDVSFRVRVLEDPSLNAFALPNGAILMNSGILARMDNEAQLAAVLGHEMTHVSHRHAIRELHAAQNQRMRAAALSVGLSLAGAVAETAAGVPGIGLAGLAAEVVFFNDDLQAPPRHSH